MDKKCATCALFVVENNGCARTRTIESPDHCCGHWTKELPICYVCGSPFVSVITWVILNDEFRTVCEECCSQFGKCGTCIHSQNCDFKINPIPIPPVINITKQQGGMTITTQGINPARVAETCAKHCKCYYNEDGKQGCNRECGTCGNYTDPWTAADNVEKE